MDSDHSNAHIHPKTTHSAAYMFNLLPPAALMGSMQTCGCTLGARFIHRIPQRHACSLPAAGVGSPLLHNSRFLFWCSATDGGGRPSSTAAVGGTPAPGHHLQLHWAGGVGMQEMWGCGLVAGACSRSTTGRSPLNARLQEALPPVMKGSEEPRIAQATHAAISRERQGKAQRG